MSEDVIVGKLIDVRALSLDELFPEKEESALKIVLDRILADNLDQATDFQSSI